MGRLHVGQMLEELTPQEFNQWWASAIVEGWAEGRELSGQICAEIANARPGIKSHHLRSAHDYTYFAERQDLMTAAESEMKAASLYG